MIRTTTIPYFKHDAGQFLTETMGLPDGTAGIYAKLMCIYWIGNCRLPEREDLEYQLGIKTKQQREGLDYVLRRFFPGDDPKHPRLDMCQFEALEASKKQRERAEKRWAKTNSKPPAIEDDSEDF